MKARSFALTATSGVSRILPSRPHHDAARPETIDEAHRPLLEPHRVHPAIRSERTNCR
jgi:hypothetical protein